MQDQVLTAWPAARPGMRYDMEPKTDIQMINKNPATAEVRKIVVSTAVGSTTTYAWTLMGVAQSISSASSDKAVIAAAIAAAIIADPLTGGYVTAVGDGTDTATITYRVTGTAFTLADSDSNLVASLVTAAAAATAVPFGAGLIADSGDTSNFKQARLTASGGLTAMSWDLTPANINDATYHVAVKFNEIWYADSFLADSSATVDEIVDGLVTQLNGLLPASTVLAAADLATATKLVLTSEVEGMPIEVKAWGDGPTVQWTIARADSGGAFADIDQVFAGLAVEDQRVAGDVGSTNLSYSGSSAMTVRRRGIACVLVQDAAVTVGAAVWVGIGSGYEGLFRTTASGADYARCKKLQWRGAAGTYNAVNQGWLEVV